MRRCRHGDADPAVAQGGTIDWAAQAPWIGGVINKLRGLLVTVCAVSLGAPFWFDLLSKFVNIRRAGIKPEEKKVA